MSEPLNPLMREFLIWVASRPRTYTDAMEAWQSHCPRQTIWEDAFSDGLIRLNGNGSTNGSEVTLTPRGRVLLNGDR